MYEFIFYTSHESRQKRNENQFIQGANTKFASWRGCALPETVRNSDRKTVLQSWAEVHILKNSLNKELQIAGLVLNYASLILPLLHRHQIMQLCNDRTFPIAFSLRVISEVV